MPAFNPRKRRPKTPKQIEREQYYGALAQARSASLATRQAHDRLKREKGPDAPETKTAFAAMRQASEAHIAVIRRIRAWEKENGDLIDAERVRH